MDDNTTKADESAEDALLNAAGADSEPVGVVPMSIYDRHDFDQETLNAAKRLNEYGRKHGGEWSNLSDSERGGILTIEDAEKRVSQISGEIMPHSEELRRETNLSDREADVAAMYAQLDGLLTQSAMAIVLGLSGEEKEEISPSSVAEYHRRGKGKTLEAARTLAHLRTVFYNAENWECPCCESLVDLSEYPIPPTSCPECGEEYFLELGKAK